MIYFVGAGPGAVDLITVRGKRLLQKADVIIYAGSLVNPELLEYARKDCQLYNSAKMTLEEVISVMENAEKENLITIRLQTGDQTVYGAATSLSLEYTLPEVSQSLIITRLAGKTSVPETESIESFAAHHASMAVYLSTGMLKELTGRLIAGGYEADTPAALVYKATWQEEEAYICTVETLCEVAEAHGIKKTALVLVGDVIAHRNYAKSRLYAADFETEFRKATQDNEREV